jgi:pimeloyl-ACP methyl ester carboxylesterase
MPKQKAMQDVIVLLPGIMGSVLQHNDKDLWAISAQGIWNLLTNMSDALGALKLQVPDPRPDELETMIRQNPRALDDLGDGIRATRLMADIHMIPGLWKIDGYSAMKRIIRERFNVTEGHLDDDTPANFFEFPYDWRRDNRVAAHRLKSAMTSKLRIWRECSGAKNAQLILIAHSMGGLVSRYYLEALDGWRDCKLLVTFGTPYRGSLNAVNYIVNGYKQLFLDFTDIVRTCTGVYQLLPDYQVIKAVNGRDASHHRVDEINLPNLDRARAAASLAFHEEINEAVKNHRNDAKYNDGLRVKAIIGARQPTAQAAVFENGALTLTQTILNPDFENLADGDGTVPRVSAIPPEKFKNYEETYFVDKHGAIQTNANALEHIVGLLDMTQTPNLPLTGVREVERRPDAISLHLDDLYVPGESVIIRARVLNGEPVPLQARLKHVQKEQGQTFDLQYQSDGWQSVSLENLTPGPYRVQIRPVHRGPDPVHDVFEVAG